MTHAFLPDLIAAEESHLVHMASAAGLIGLPWGSSYAASKWAVLGFSESLRLELASLGHRHVGVTAVCASYAGTGMRGRPAAAPHLGSGKAGGYYGCLGAAKGACDNKMLVRRKLAETVILEAVREQLAARSGRAHPIPARARG